MECGKSRCEKANERQTGASERRIRRLGNGRGRERDDPRVAEGGMHSVKHRAYAASFHPREALSQNVLSMHAEARERELGCSRQVDSPPHAAARRVCPVAARRSSWSDGNAGALGPLPIALRAHALGSCCASASQTVRAPASRAVRSRLLETSRHDARSLFFGVAAASQKNWKLLVRSRSWSRSN